MNIDLYQLVRYEKNIYIKLPNSFKQFILRKIKRKFSNLTKYQQVKRKDIKYVTLRALLIYGEFTLLTHIIKIIKDLDINEKILFNQIQNFRMRGSKVNTPVPRYLNPDPNFFLGYGLYIAEGDTGLNGNTIPCKVRFSNTTISIIFFFKQ